MKKIFSLLIMAEIFFGKISYAQTNTFPSTGPAGIGTTSPDPSSLLDIVSTSKGILTPRMTKAQRDAISLPSTGLLIYQTNSTPGFYYYTGSAWTAISTKGPNKNLSNLTAPTAINVDLLPATDNSVSLGSSSLRWKDVNVFNLKFADGTTQTTAASSGANFSLSNLSSTSINQSLLPNANNTFDLGSSALNWKNIYGAGSYYIGSAKVLDITGTENSFIAATGNTTNTGSYNTASGSNSLNSNTSGSSNTAFGDRSLQYNTTGYNNLAIGGSALRNNTTGYSNTALGIGSMYSNTTGYQNAAVGEDALYYNTTGIYNIAVGEFALYHNTTGSENTAVGHSAMTFNTTGSYNAACGIGALDFNTTGSYNTASGFNALESNTIGFYNTANGSSALASNTTGYYNTACGNEALLNNTTGNYNTASGLASLSSNTTGIENSAHGVFALYSNTTGNNNTACGFQALYLNTAGDRNTSVGDSAGLNVISGSNNTFIGYAANCGVQGVLTNSTAIGNGASVTSSNTFVFGNSSITGWGFGTNPGSRAIKVGTSSSNGNGAYLTTGGVWTDISDQNKKENITELDKNSVLEKILQLKISEWKYRGTENEYHIGPMAEDFHRLFEVGDDNSISSMDKTGVLFLAVQALSEQNERLKSEISDLKSLIESREASLTDGFLKLQTPNFDSQTLLGQNIPNPFDNSTLIPFRIPKDCKDASIMIANTSTSEVISLIPISCNEDHVRIDAGTLTSGTYSYSLYVDGKMIDTKQMVLTK